MKSLSLTTPHVIFVIGMPGAGKTHFATKFSETFGAPFVEADQLRRITTSNQPIYDQNEQSIVDQLVHQQIGELLKTKQTFIVEAATEARIDRQNLSKLARSNGYQTLYVWVQTDPETARLRATKSGRINKDKALILPVTRYEQLIKRFTAPTPTENVTVISGKHTYASQARAVLKRLAGQNRPDDTALQVPPRRVSKPKGSSIKIS